MVTRVSNTNKGGFHWKSILKHRRAQLEAHIVFVQFPRSPAFTFRSGWKTLLKDHLSISGNTNQQFWRFERAVSRSFRLILRTIYNSQTWVIAQWKKKKKTWVPYLTIDHTEGWGHLLHLLGNHPSDMSGVFYTTEINHTNQSKNELYFYTCYFGLWEESYNIRTAQMWAGAQR